MGYIKYNYNRDYFESIDTEDKAYWLGFIAADGNVSAKMNSMRINLNIVDVNHLEKFRKSINGNQPIRENNRIKNHSVYIDMNSQKVCFDLLKYGVTPKKSLTLDINFDLLSDELKHHFIRGYFDGDGSINLYRRPPYYYDEWEVSFISTKKVLLKFEEYFGIAHTIYTCGNNFRVCYKSKKDIKHILNYMYSDATIFLNRKYEKVQDFLKSSETIKE